MNGARLGLLLWLVLTLSGVARGDVVRQEDAITTNSPVLYMSDASLDLGIILSDWTTVPKYLTLGNTGTADLTISDFTVTGGQASLFQVGTLSQSVLTPGSYTSIKLTASATALGTYSTEIRFDTNDPDHPSVVIPLSFKVVSQLAQLTVYWNSGYFGTRGTGAPASLPLTFHVLSSGNLPLQFTSMTLAGNNPEDFVLETPDLSPMPVIQNRDFHFRFRPTAAGYRWATIQIRTNDANLPLQEFTISGIGSDEPVAVLELDPQGNYQFPQVPVPLGAVQRMIQMTNDGDTTLTFSPSAPQLLSGTAGVYQLGQPGSFADLAPGATREVPVSFDPPAAQAYSSTFDLLTNDPDGDDFSVYGSGTNSYPLLSAPTAVSFPDACLGDGVSLGFVITNGGNQSGYLDPPTISGPNASDFSASEYSSPNGSSLPAGSYGALLLTFHPSSTGLKEATMRITTSDALLPAIEVSLSGAAISSRPRIEASLEAIDFGGVPSGMDPTPRTVVIANTGSEPLVLGTPALQITGDDAGLFAINGPLIDGRTLQPDDNLSVEVVFVPGGATSASASLQVASNDPVQPTLELPLTGTTGAELATRLYDGNGPGRSTIGQGGTYASLAEAASAIAAADLTGGDWTFEIVSDLVESQNAVILAPSTGHRLTVRPAAGTQARVDFTSTAGLANLLIQPRPGKMGANVVLDGSATPGGTTRDLTLRGPSSTTAKTLVWMRGTVFGAAARNLVLLHRGTGTSLESYAFLSRYDVPFEANGFGGGPGWFTLEGSSLTATATLYSAALGCSTDQHGLLIRNNEIDGSRVAVNLGAGRSSRFFGNRVRVHRSSAGTNSSAMSAGGNRPGAVCVIENNVFDEVLAPITSSYISFDAISIYSAPGTELNFINNHISGVRLTGSGSATRLSGFFVLSSGNSTINLIHNTISLVPSANSYTGLNTANCYGVGVFNSTFTGTLRMYNNVVRNGQPGGCAVFLGASGMKYEGNGNNYYASSGNIGRVFGSLKTTMDGWRASLPGQDVASVSFDPLPYWIAGSTLPTNTRFFASNGTLFDAAAYPGVTLDADGEPRGSVTVKMGADEPFDPDADGIPSVIEAGAPNGGDGNSDGTPDDSQAGVASLPLATSGKFVTLVASEGALEGVTSRAASAISDPLPAGVTLPLGILSFAVSGLAEGGTTEVDIQGELPADIGTYYKYGRTADNSVAHWYQFLNDGTTGAVLSPLLKLKLKDGARGDDDLEANGTIVDPGGPALVPAAPVGWELY